VHGGAAAAAPVGLRAVLLLAGALSMTGCAGWLAPAPPLAASAVELDGTVFHPQDDFLCGPAALATVLDSSGVSVAPQSLTDDLYLPARRGTLQVELAAAARRHGRLAVQLDGTLDDLVAQLEHDRPVLVLQNLASTLLPVWHYAVVVGYLPDGERFVLRSGRERRLQVRRGRFEATWERAGRWALVVVDPDATPVGLPRAAYLRAAADLENTGRHALALGAFRSALATWPDDASARLGEANNLYYLGDRDAAAAVYRQLLSIEPQHPVALHNLAMVLLEQGRVCEADAVLRGGADAGGALVDTARRAVAAAAAGCGGQADDGSER
jgi:tetratricopeptide (TPR) repeat protein